MNGKKYIEKVINEVKLRNNGEEELIEGKSISDKVDLKLLKYTPTHDLALVEEEGMFLSREYPIPTILSPLPLLNLPL